MLTVKNLSFAYAGGRQRAPVLASVNLQVANGEILAVIGPSGCGKSTLLCLLAGLLPAGEGEITLDGARPVERRRDIALILQEYGLFPWKTARQNIILGLEMRGVSAKERSRLAEAILAELEIASVADSYPDRLSGGQKQRVAIARSLVTQPALLLMDEPFSALDALTREKLQALLLGLWRSRRMTVVLVTHNIEEAVFLGQRVAVFSPLPGRVVEVVDNPGVGEPDYRASAEFLAKVTYVRSRLTAVMGNGGVPA